MPVPKEILYLTENDVQKTISYAEAVDLAEKGIKADAAGKVNGDKYYMNVGEDSFSFLYEYLRTLIKIPYQRNMLDVLWRR